MTAENANKGVWIATVTGLELERIKHFATLLKQNPNLIPDTITLGEATVEDVQPQY